MSHTQAAAAAAFALVLGGLAPGALAAVVGAGGRGFLAGTGGERMQPDVVAQTLSAVEEEWKSQAAVFAECNVTAAAQDEGDMRSVCSRAEKAFQKSCATVAGAVVQGSGGNRANVEEYMADVCAQQKLVGWHREQCSALSAELVSSMSMIDVDNRESLDVSAVCGKFFAHFAASERERLAKERAEDEAREKKAEEKAATEQKAEEERAKKAAEEAAQAAAKTKAEEESRAKEAEEVAMAEAAKAEEAKAEDSKAEEDKSEEAKAPSSKEAQPAKAVEASVEEAKAAVAEARKPVSKGNATA